ncbi:MAG: flagellar hook assembly protein FlgD [Pseudomonadota bacterium]
METAQNTSVLDSLGLNLASTNRKPKSDDSLKLSQDQFFKLMTAQLKNQDPTKPLDNAEFLSQIAQISTVTGIQDLQSGFRNLSASLQGNQLVQGASLMGRSVLTPSDLGRLPPGGALGGAVDLPEDATSIIVTILDGNGQILQRSDLGAHKAGLVQFGWNGVTADGLTAPAGLYSVKAEALMNGKTSAVGTLAKSTVESITLGAVGEGVILGLSGLGNVALTEVRQILN